MSYSYNTRNEKPPKKKQLLPQGWRTFKFIDCKEKVSKANNHMFAFGVVDKETGYEEEIYALTADGKRWFLKLILTACGIEEDADGNVNFEPSDIIGKEVEGLVEHEPNSYINREGQTVNTVQHRIVDIKKSEWPQ